MPFNGELEAGGESAAEAIETEPDTTKADAIRIKRLAVGTGWVDPLSFNICRSPDGRNRSGLAPPAIKRLFVVGGGLVVDGEFGQGRQQGLQVGAMRRLEGIHADPA